MWNGSLVALVTPMKPNGEVDFSTLDKLLQWHCEQKTDGLVLLGTTGESPTISDDERKKMIAAAVSQCKGKMPVIVGTGANCTRHAMELTAQAHELGADAALIVTPYYNKPTQDGLYEHYQAIAKAVSIPQVLYNVPSRTACDLLPETVARLAKLDQVVAIKETTADMSRLDLLGELCDITIYSGDDIRVIDYISHGAKGVISVAANIVPKAIHALCKAALASNWDEAQAIFDKHRSLFELLFVESNPIPTKWAMTELGLIESGIRLPLTPLNVCYHAQLREALQQL